MKLNFIPISKARVNLGNLVKKVYMKGEFFVLEKNGIPIASLVSVAFLKKYLRSKSKLI